MSFSTKKITKAKLQAILEGQEGDTGIELTDLEDVELDEPAEGEVLKYVDGEWVNAVNIPAIAAPVAANSPGLAGQIAFDADFAYFCTAANTWKRAAIATWP